MSAWQKICRVEDIPVLGARRVARDGAVAVAVFRNSEDKVFALASERSAGTDVEFGNAQLEIGDLAHFDFSKVDYALFSAGGSVSKEFAPKAAAAGAIVIDNTSAFRYEDDIPLVVPEV